MTRRRRDPQESLNPHLDVGVLLREHREADTHRNGEHTPAQRKHLRNGHDRADYRLSDADRIAEGCPLGSPMLRDNLDQADDVRVGLVQRMYA